MKIDQDRDGTPVILLEIGERVIIRGIDIDVALEEASNTYMLPIDVDDVDEVGVTAERRPESDYP